jgi:YfiH family protein
VSDVLVPSWRGPARVRALFTTRAIEVPGAALRERLPADPVWLAQVHGSDVVEIDAPPASPPRADAAVTRTPGVVITVRTADCLPVLLAHRDASVLAVAHAGWRGLAAGVLEATVRAMRVDARDIAVWIGPAIGPQAFEIGRDVYDAYCVADPASASYFAPYREGKWLADLAGLARHRLARIGVTSIDGGQWCTYTDRTRFFSYRREKGEGRMALAAWLATI